MSEIFLSASIPVAGPGRGKYYKTAKPYLIQLAVRELIIAVIKQHKIVWGGHPAITPMIWSICKDLNVDYGQQVILYQSRYFEERFPEENKHFKNVIYTNAVKNDQDASLKIMRDAMLSRDGLEAGVFIGGMEGIIKEFDLFRHYNPNAKLVPLAAPGGAAIKLTKKIKFSDIDFWDVNFAKIFHKVFSASHNGNMHNTPSSQSHQS